MNQEVGKIYIVPKNINRNGNRLFKGDLVLCAHKSSDEYHYYFRIQKTIDNGSSIRFDVCEKVILKLDMEEAFPRVSPLSYEEITYSIVTGAISINSKDTYSKKLLNLIEKEEKLKEELKRVQSNIISEK